MKSVLITGGTGFIGINLAKFLDSVGYSVTVISRQTDFNVGARSSIQFYGAINNLDSLEAVFKRNKFDVIIHLATFYCHSPSMDEVSVMVESNLKFGISILELADKYKCKNLINACSTAEFGMDGIDKPNSLYASTKASFRSICQYYSDKRHFNIIHLVLYDNYGFNDGRGKIIDKLISKLGSEDSLDMSPGDQILYPVHINDTVRAFEKTLTSFSILASSKGNIFCVAPAEGISLKKLSKLIEKIGQQEVNVNWGALPYRENENMTPWVGQRLTHWSVSMYLEEGLKQLILKV